LFGSSSLLYRSKGILRFCRTSTLTISLSLTSRRIYSIFPIAYLPSSLDSVPVEEATRPRTVYAPVTALQALKDGVFSSIGEAATAFNLPKSSLAHRRNSRQTRQQAHEGDQIISPAAEKAIVKWILKLDDYGFPSRLDRLWQMVEKRAVEERAALKARYKAEGGKNKVHDTIGNNWITQFLNRHPELASKMAKRMDRQRVFANNLTTIADHFKKLGKVIRTERLRPHQITNVDEKGIILGYSSKSKVITRRGKKSPYVRQHGKREMVTLMEAISADGYIFPTFLITKGKVHTYRMFGNVQEQDAEVRFGKSPKGWTDDELGYYWLTKIYHPYSLKRIQHGEKRLLILDGHGSHITLEFTEFCEAHDIILFCLPAPSTHNL
jgi:hypothetical protein